MSNRQLVLTRRVESKFGTLYVHAGYEDGRITELAISSPGKFSDTTMGALFDALGDAATALITEINAAGGLALAKEGITQ